MHGIPVFWQDAPLPFTASLLFRVGRADETFVSAGITHLVEHLSIFALGKVPVVHNGSVDLLLTRFFARGDRVGVLTYLQDVARRLHQLPLDRLEGERRVLAAEAGRGVRSPVGALLAARFGARGFGLADVREHGLRSLSGEQVSAWADDRFGRANAAVWMTGPPPDDFDLSLPEGRRCPVPPSEPIPHLSLPSCTGEDYLGVAIGYVFPRNPAAKLACDMAAGALQDRLRRQDALSYEVGYDWQPLSGHQAHATLAAECPRERVDAVRDSLLDELEHQRKDGPGPELRAHAHAMEEQSLSEPGMVLSWLDSSCRDELLGEPLGRSPAEFLEERRAIPSAELAPALSAALDSTILMVPTGTRIPKGFQPYRRDSRQVAGRPYGRWPAIDADAPKGRPSPAERFVLGPKGISHIVEGMGGASQTVRFENCAGVLVTRFGELIFQGDDNVAVGVPVAELIEGEAFLEEVRRHVPSGLFVSIDEPPERWNQMVELARARFGRPSSTWLDLEMLALHLEPHELVEEMATASRDGKTGLLAVTGRRLLWVRHPRGGQGEAPVEAPRGEVREAKAGRGGAFGLGLTLTVAGTRGQSLVFKRVEPADAGRTLARSLNGQPDG
jgi:hypothetical protein